MDTQNDTQSQPNLMDRAICISVELHRMGTKRRVASGMVKADGTDPDMLHVSKDILECDSMAAIITLDGQIRQFVARRCLPSMFRSGVYLVPIDSVEEIDAKLEELAGKRRDLIEKFIDEYESVKNKAESRLGPLFNDADYPSIDRVRQSFGMHVQYIEFSTPGRLKTLSAALYQREQAKVAAQMTSAVEQVKTLLRSEMAEFVSHLVDRLTPAPDGKARKVFRDTAVTNVRAFLETFQSRNIVDDAELAALVDRAKDVIDGVEPDWLRSDESLREFVRDNFSQIRSELDGMLTNAPRRKFNFAGAAPEQAQAGV